MKFVQFYALKPCEYNEKHEGEKSSKPNFAKASRGEKTNTEKG